MKETKRQFKIFSFFDFDGITAHLEKMAADGWMIEQNKNRYWVYRRTEPKKLKFAVTYFPKASDFDPRPTEELQAFNEFCRQAGWKPAVSMAQMQIYYNENENPVPIETDPLVQINTIHRAMKRNFIPSYIIMIAISVLVIAMFGMRVITNPVSALSSNSTLFSIVAYGVLLTMSVVELGRYYSWRKKAVARAESGYAIPSGKTAFVFQIVTLIMVIGLMTVYLFSSISIISPWFMLFMFALFGSSGVIAVFMKEFLRKRNVPRKVNMFVSMGSAFAVTMALAVLTVFVVIKYNIRINPQQSKPVGTYTMYGRQWDIYNDTVPLRIEDFMQTDYSDFDVRNNTDGSVFISKADVSQTATVNREGVPELRYEITTVHMPALYDLCFETVFNDIDETNTDRDIPLEFRCVLVQQQDNAWQADKVYRLKYGEEYTDQWLICWGNKIADITFYNIEHLTDSQKAIIAEKLKDF